MVLDALIASMERYTGQQWVVKGPDRKTIVIKIEWKLLMIDLQKI